MDLGFCARVGEVEVRLSASGTDAPARLEEASRTIRAELGDDVFGEADETFEEVVVRSLGQHRKTVALAESCTGGHIANRITNVPGASAVFLGGFVTYANDVKSRVLGVSESSIAKHGAVSEPVAREMAEGARKLAGADYALGVTGIAGPGGGTPEKPVGTVFIALAGPEGTEVRQFLNALDRETFKFLTAQQALKMLFKRLNALDDR
jgi:nicotinamide-nucleotide amidase